LLGTDHCTSHHTSFFLSHSAKSLNNVSKFFCPSWSKLLTFSHHVSNILSAILAFLSDQNIFQALSFHSPGIGMIGMLDASDFHIFITLFAAHCVSGLAAKDILTRNRMIAIAKIFTNNRGKRLTNTELAGTSLSVL
jgi:prenyltransferase beta subunit